MNPYVTTAPHCEPPVAPRIPTTPGSGTPPRCSGRPDLRSGRRVPHGAHAPRHHATTHFGPRHRAATHVVADAPGCRHFAELVLRSVLEVLDRRRHPSSLDGLLATTPLDLVTALTRAGAPGRTLGAATLHRVHVSSSGPNGAEVFGSYGRGPRTFAIACRVERVAPAPLAGTGSSRSAARTTTHRRNTGRSAAGWVVTSLHVG